MFEHIRAIAFDLDGTVYMGSDVIEGAADTIEYFKKLGLKIIFCTNTSSKTRNQIASKLSQMGIECSEEQIYPSGWASIQYMKSAKVSSVWVVGTDSFVSEISKSFKLSGDPESADCLIVGFDPEFNYERLTYALRAALHCRLMIFCSVDAEFVGEGGKVYPSCGGMAFAIQGCSNRNPDMIIGKPSPYMMSLITNDTGFSPEEILVVGDRYESDILFAQNSGSESVLISDQIHHGVNIVNNIVCLKDLFKVSLDKKGNIYEVSEREYI